jgi:hypothetical protein
VFPIAHVWLLERLIPAPAPAHYIGCAWPDMLFASPISHHDSHQRGDSLLAFARARCDAGLPGADEFLAFVTGAITHGSNPYGFDWYSDEQYGDDPTLRGYAFQRGAPLADATAAACHLAPQYGHWKAHNIVEMACELPLHAADPHQADRFAAACADTSLVERLSRSLADFFGGSPEALAAPIRGFADWWARPTSTEALAEAYARQVHAKHGVPDADEAALAALIGQAGELIAPDRESFLATCAHQVGDLLDRLALR